MRLPSYAKHANNAIYNFALALLSWASASS
jgi:hypothetical protein